MATVATTGTPKVQGPDAIETASKSPLPSVDLSNPSDEESDTDYREDWNKVTAERDSFSHQELRRNIGGLQWKNIEGYAKKPKGSKERAGSILSSFEIGHENGVKIPEDPEERDLYERKRQAALAIGDKIEGIENYPQLQKDAQEGRLGSVLSAFTKQNQHFDDAIIIPDERPTERRPSIAAPTIGKIENYPTLSKDSGRSDANGTILSVFKDDHDDVLAAAEVNIPGSPSEKSIKAGRKGITFSPSSLEAPKIPNSKKVGERRGSVLSIWSDRSDAFSSDEEGDDLTSISSSGASRRSSKLDPPSAKALRRPSSSSGREHRGSILSLWSNGKDKDGIDTIHHGDEDSE